MGSARLWSPTAASQNCRCTPPSIRGNAYLVTEQREFGLAVSSATWPQPVCPSAADVAPAPDAPQTCYTVVQPGLQSGSMYIEFQVQSMHPSSRGIGGLKFWVVSSGCPACLALCWAPTVHLLSHFGGLGRILVRRDMSLGWWAGSSFLRGQRDSICQQALQDHIMVWPCAAGVPVGMEAATCLTFPVYAIFGAAQGTPCLCMPSTVLSCFSRWRLSLVHLCVAAHCSCSSSKT